MGTSYYMPPEQRCDAKTVNHTAETIPSASAAAGCACLTKGARRAIEDARRDRLRHLPRHPGGRAVYAVPIQVSELCRRH